MHLGHDPEIRLLQVVARHRHGRPDRQRWDRHRRGHRETGTANPQLAGLRVPGQEFARDGEANGVGRAGVLGGRWWTLPPVLPSEHRGGDEGGRPLLGRLGTVDRFDRLNLALSTSAPYVNELAVLVGLECPRANRLRTDGAGRIFGGRPCIHPNTPGERAVDFMALPTSPDPPDV